MSISHPAALSRRGFLGVAGVAALTATTACGPTGGDDTGGAKASADVTLPTYKEFTGVKPDHPGNEAGLQPVYLKMPSEFIAATLEAPLKAKVSGLTETFSTPPPPMGSNPFWQRLNAKLGSDLELIIGTDPGYPEKFATILASDDLPDVMWLPPNQGIPNVGPMLEAKFADLTSYLAGDAVLEYPNLAALKPASWRTAVVNGKIWGAPIPSTPFGQVMIGNPKAWDQVGGFQCKTADEFFEKAKELTRPNEKKYALEPAYINMLHMFGEWFGAPNGWRVNADRTLTGSYETDEYQAAVEFAAKVFAAGCFYPDANLPDGRPKVAQGQISAFVSVGPTGIGELRDFDQTMQGEALIPFGWDGKAKPIYDMGYGTVGFTPFRKAEEGRIRELLSMINYLSAPFGTAEYVQKNFGEADQDFSLDGNGNPALTTAGQTNVPGSGQRAVHHGQSGNGDLQPGTHGGLGEDLRGGADAADLRHAQPDLRHVFRHVVEGQHQDRAADPGQGGRHHHRSGHHGRLPGGAEAVAGGRRAQDPGRIPGGAPGGRTGDRMIS